MSCMTLHVSLNIASAMFAAFSAFCWWKSSVVTVPHAHSKDTELLRDGSISLDGNDLFESLRAQSKWNKRAACFASIAALCQVGVIASE